MYNYTKNCTYSKAWDEVTLKSRGIVYDKATKEIVTYVMPKFFNIGETEGTLLHNLPWDKPFRVYEKLDGSCVHASNYKGRWIISTRGSFESPQAQEARKIIRHEKNYNLNPDLSYVFEVIYPENGKSYGDVVLLTAFDKTKEGLELTRGQLKTEAIRLAMPICKEYLHTKEQLLELQKTLDSQTEGFVVVFENGIKVKIKSLEYLRMQKILCQMSPLSIWDAFECFDLPNKYIENLEEELQVEATEIATKIHQQMDLILYELKSFMMTKVPEVNKDDPTWRKQLGLWLKDFNCDPGLKKMVFPWILGLNKEIFKYIKEKARPAGNNLNA